MNVKKLRIVPNPASRACSFLNFPLGNKKGAIKRVFLAVIVIGVSLLARSFAVPWSGSGNSSDPYQITNYTQLQNMSINPTSYFELTNDIDCVDTINWNSGAGFEPIANRTLIEYKFRGEFYGQGYTITDLFINRPYIFF